jgi:hypothetical protein
VSGGRGQLRGDHPVAGWNVSAAVWKTSWLAAHGYSVVDRSSAVPVACVGHEAAIATVARGFGGHGGQASQAGSGISTQAGPTAPAGGIVPEVAVGVPAESIGVLLAWRRIVVSACDRSYGSPFPASRTDPVPGCSWLPGTAASARGARSGS